MSFDGNGNYNPPAPAFPAISGQVIYAADFNAVINDIAAAISNCIAKDGQSGVTANLNFGGNRIINLAPGVSATDAVTKAQVFTNPVFTTTTAEGLVVSGTGFTVTVTNTNMTATALHVALQTERNDSDLAANTAFVQRAVATAVAAVTDGYTDLVQAEETARIAADNLLAPKLNANMTSPTISDATLTGTPTAPNPNPLTDSEQVATCHFVKQQAFQTVLPNQAGNHGKVLRTNGTDAEWAAYLEPGDILFSARVPPVPVFLPCDGLPRLKSSYAELAAVLGVIPTNPAYTLNKITGAEADIYYTAYGNGVYVGLAPNASPLHTTTDLSSWTKRALTITNYPVGLAFGAGLFVMILYGENYRTSPDGITWTSRGSQPGYGVAYGNGVFLSLANPLKVSTNGLTFKNGAALPEGFSTSGEVFFVNGYFYIQDFNGRLLRTRDGSSCALVYDTSTGTSTNCSVCGNSNGVLFSGDDHRVVKSVDNGLTWVDVTASVTGRWPTFCNGMFQLFGSSLGFYSIDGVTFTAGPALSAGAIRSAKTCNNVVIIGQSTNETTITGGNTYDTSTQFITPYSATALPTTNGVNAYIKTGLEI